MLYRSLLAAAVALAGSLCAAAPAIDPSTVDSVCAQTCSANQTTCTSGFKLFPLANQWSCGSAFDTCLKTCPTKAEKAAAAASAVSAPSSAPGPSANTAADRLKNLEALLKEGLITKEEYDAKRAEVIKAL